MTKYILILAATILTAISCEQSAPLPADLSGYTSQSIAGSQASRVLAVNGDGVPTSSGYVLNGSKVAQWMTYHPDGKVKTVTNYIDGKKTGTHMEFTTRGQIEMLATYTNDIMDGPYAKYKFGRPIEEMQYKKRT